MVVVGGGGAVDHLPVAMLDLHSGLVIHRRDVIRVAVAHLHCEKKTQRNIYKYETTEHKID